MSTVKLKLELDNEQFIKLTEFLVWLKNNKLKKKQNKFFLKRN